MIRALMSRRARAFVAALAKLGEESVVYDQPPWAIRPGDRVRIPSRYPPAYGVVQELHAERSATVQCDGCGNTQAWCIDQLERDEEG